MVIVNVESAPAQATESGTELRVLLDTTVHGQGRMSLAVEILQPGQHTCPHWHAHLEEIYFILQGRGQMEIGAEVRGVRQGDAILIPQGQVHCLTNTGNEDLVLLCPVSPPWVADDYHTGPAPM